MKRTKLIAISVCATILLQFMCQSTLYAQAISPRNQLLKITALSDSLTHARPAEKSYLQFDKPYYALGDTIWFKAYLFNNYLMPSRESGILNIDMLSDSGKVIKQYRLPVQGGLSWGNIYLDDKEYKSGTYTLRAYTNWMRNFDGDYVYYKTIDVTGAGEKNLLVNTWFTTSANDGNNTVNAKLLFSKMDKVPFAVEPLNLQVIGSGKRLYRQQMRTGVDGKLDVNFIVPPKATNLAIVAESEQKDKKAIIPVTLNGPENIDVQFMPEGGNLVAGLPAHVAFKAIGGDGRGVNVSGIIVNQLQKQVAVFTSLHNGIGGFDLAVEAGLAYTAKVTLPGGTMKDYPLPPVKTSGTVLQVKNGMEGDSVEVTTSATEDIAQTGESYFLIGRARGIVCYAAVVNFKNGSVTRKIAKSLFPTGIAHFTLMTNQNQPLNERLAFFDHNDDLTININTNKTVYGKRDSVALTIKVIDKNGNPVNGNLSLAITDDASVKTDSLNNENILTRMLLTSDIKGYVETPGYYFASKTNENWQALDNLLLTQGWVGYDWKEVFNPPAVTWQPEKELQVKGHVGNVFNKGVKATHVILFSKKPAMLMDTVTDNSGNFVFNRFPPIDTPVFVLKAVNKNGKSFNVGITVDDMHPPDFTMPKAPVTMPWYVNSDSTLLNYTKNNALLKQQQNFPAGGHVLKEVKITAKKIVRGSQNLNGPGGADLVLDEKDMEKAGKKSLLQLLEENVENFHEGYFVQGGMKAIQDSFLMAYVTASHSTAQWYFVNRKPVIFIFDGVSLAQAISTPVDPVFFLTIKDYLSGHSAEDVKGIEVIHSPGYAAEYFTRFLPDGLLIKAIYRGINIAPSDIAVVEITTRGGHGPLIDYTPGMYLYKPLLISWPKQFYKPKYAVKDTSGHIMDLRTTIDWEPNIITDKNGEAKFSFYTADKSSTYIVTIEGADMNGGIGYKKGKIKVVAPNAAGK